MLKNKKKYIYAILTAFILTVSLILSYGNIKNFTWDSVFKIAELSEKVDVLSDAEMYVHFLDVGKADCAYIKCGDKNILIDAGDRDPSETVVSYLKNQKVEKFDLVVESHPHRDHIGQMESVIREFPIDKFVEPEIQKDKASIFATYEYMLRALKEKNVPIELVKAGKEYNIGDLRIEILGPISQNMKNMNNNSIVMKIIYKNVSFLFMGDAEKAEENAILDTGTDLKADVLKVGHHGSSTSSTYKFLGAVLPTYAVISVALDRSNLPKESVIGRLDKFCEKVYRTDVNGNVVFSVKNGKINVQIQKFDVN